MAVEHLYQVKVKWEEGRLGKMTSKVLDSELSVATPPEFPKGIEGVWSPEHYFLAAVNGCLMTTFLAVAENSKLNYKFFSCDAVGKLEKVDRKFMMSEIILRPSIGVHKQEDMSLAMKVIEKAKKACLISNSIKSEVKMEIEVFAGLR